LFEFWNLKFERGIMVFTIKNKNKNKNKLVLKGIISFGLFKKELNTQVNYVSKSQQE